MAKPYGGVKTKQEQPGRKTKQGKAWPHERIRATTGGNALYKELDGIFRSAEFKKLVQENNDYFGNMISEIINNCYKPNSKNEIKVRVQVVPNSTESTDKSFNDYIQNNSYINNEIK